MSLVEDLKNKYNAMLLPVQTVAAELGITEAGVNELIASGMLPSFTVDGSVRISIQALVNMLDFSPALSGQHASGQSAEEELYCRPDFEREVDSMKREYTGSVSALKDGRFMAQVVVGWDADGKRIRKSAGFKDRESAEKYVEEKVRILKSGGNYDDILIPATATTPEVVGTYTDKTFEEYSVDVLNSGVGRATPRTTEGYRISLSPIIKEIGKNKMVEIDKDTIKPLFSRLSYKYNNASLKKSFRTTKKIFDIAVENGDIPNDFFSKLQCPRSQKPVKDERTPYSTEDRQAIMKYSREYENKVLYTMFAILDCTGMRPSELRALEWSAFDERAKKMHIYQAVTKTYEKIESITKKPKDIEIISTTKSIYSKRKLTLTDMAVAALLEWRKELDTMPRAMRDSKYIFPSKDGSFKSESSVISLIHRFEKKYGIEDLNITLYRFRHTFCTNLVLSGYPIAVVQRLMGDNTADVIMKVYTHVSNEQADIVSKAFYENLNQQYIQDNIFTP